MLILKNSQVSFYLFCCTFLHPNCTPRCTTSCTISAFLKILLNVVNHTKQIGHWLQCIAWRLRLLLSKTMGSKTSDSLPAYIRYDSGRSGDPWSKRILFTPTRIMIIWLTGKKWLQIGVCNCKSPLPAYFRLGCFTATSGHFNFLWTKSVNDHDTPIQNVEEDGYDDWPVNI